MNEKEKILFRKTYGEQKYREFVQKNRQTSDMKTGTVTFRSKKDYNRQANKNETRKMSGEYE